MAANIGFLWPYAALALPLPWLLRRVLTPARTLTGALWLPVLTDYQTAAGNRRSSRPQWPLLVASLAWCLLVLAATRPVWISSTHRAPLTGRNLWVSVDLSWSMRQTDFELNGHRVTRLKAAKKVARDFIAGRRGDRVGLLVFGTHAYVQAPLTLDRRTVQILLDESQFGMAGGKTAIGDAIGLAVKHTNASHAGEQVLVLLTDGANTTGEINPLVAARLAAQRGLKIYTIGIGGGFVRDASATAQLRKIAAITGGKFARADDTQALKRSFARIDKLEPVARAEPISIYTELFPWPLGAALLVTLLGLIPFSRWRAAVS